MLTWSLDETNFLNKYVQDQKSETKKTCTKKNFAIINGVPENLLQEYSLGPEKPKFRGQVSPHQRLLFMNCSSQRLHPSYCRNKFFNKFKENLKTLQGGFKVDMFIRIESYIIEKKQLSYFI